MKVTTSSSTSTRPMDDAAERERLRQIAKRKEQNRNAQRRLRERKEEYTMQLETQIAELHRRSQSQDEQSHYLREMLSRTRAENEVLSQQLAIATNSPQSAHRASLGSVNPSEAPVSSNSALTTRPRHLSESSAAVASKNVSWWSVQQSNLPLLFTQAGVAPNETLPEHLIQTAGGMVGIPSLGELPHPGMLSNVSSQSAIESPESMSGLQGDSSRMGSTSPRMHRKARFSNPVLLRNGLRRNSSDRTEITIPSEGSEAEGPATKQRRTNTQRPVSGGMSIESLNVATAQSNDLMDGLLADMESISASSQQNLSLSNMPSNDFSAQSKPIGATPSALGLSCNVNGWSVSPWVNFGNPMDSANNMVNLNLSDPNVQESQSADDASSLASRRGFSGRLKLESNALN